MRARWRHRRVASGRLAVIRVTSVLGVVGVIAMASAGPAAPATVRPGSPVPTSTATPGLGQLSAMQKLVVGRSAALARSTAATATLAVALSGLRIQSEALTERYDREVVLAQQAAAAYQAALARLAAARKREQRAITLIGQQAAAEYESNGGPSMAEAVFTGLTDPQGYLRALGLQQAFDDQLIDLLAASKADEIVTRLFSRQAASLLNQQRAARQSAGFIRAAVIAAVARQTAVLTAARKNRSRLAAETAAARAREAALLRPGVPPLTVAPRPGEGGSGGSAGAGPSIPVGLAVSVLAGGPSGAAPGVAAPAWAQDAGATAAQGNVAANWALSQLGKPYRWGAAGPASYDCSGLALQAWARAGVRLLHWTGFQWVSGPHVPLAQLRRGDLVFFATKSTDPATIHHVGVYIGHGLMVDAPYTGAFVEIDSIYAVGGLIGATRPAA